MTLFQRRVEGDESLTLGSNSEEAREGNMYVVIVAAAGKDDTPKRK